MSRDQATQTPKQRKKWDLAQPVSVLNTENQVHSPTEPGVVVVREQPRRRLPLTPIQKTLSQTNLIQLTEQLLDIAQRQNVLILKLLDKLSSPVVVEEKKTCKTGNLPVSVQRIVSEHLEKERKTNKRAAPMKAAAHQGRKDKRPPFKA